ncbi:EamA family transporter [Mycobacterium sp. MS1601]|uniref:EamA family transporter RarD n=1 Tax=Mycobacterium sp. MS1601 TaxID=1936029 RepID=UPI0009798023|nr:EamA family transporter RarD [Mycobacterium sp. MS1601]AQA05596.1 EamA family transporter [Mycobacterium sp. MS1601]
MRGSPSTGLLYGLGAYGAWGLFPAFFPLLQPAGAFEILAQRIVWTLLFMVIVLAVVRRLGDLRRISGRTWLLLVLASVLISGNWLTYIYAVNNGHVVDAALGYFINPLVSVALGVVLFREKLNKAQLCALAIAVVAVVTLAVQFGAPPWIALVLAFTFGLYGAVKKVVPTDPRVSVGVEAAVVAPAAFVYLLVIESAGLGHFLGSGAGHVALTIASGALTAIPLLFFAAAAQRLSLVTLGLLMYVTPIMQMSWGILVGHEPMPPARWAGFALIWLALAVFSTDAILRARRGRNPPLGRDTQLG